ncbi:toxin-antitoxin system YwqK family antitoxin, partial [Aequoribacter fuscus]
MNTDNYLAETNRREQAYSRVRNIATIGKEYFTDTGKYLLEIHDATDGLTVIDVETLTAFNGNATGRTLVIGYQEEFFVGRIEANYVNGKPEGLMRGWHENGQLHHEGNFVNGQGEGLQRGWLENGQLFYENNVVNGKAEGLSRVWYW